MNTGYVQSDRENPSSHQTVIWPRSNGGMDLRLQILPSGTAFSAEMLNRVEHALEGRAVEPQAPRHDCLVIRNDSGATNAYLEQFGTQAVAPPLALFVGGVGMEIGLPPRMAWLPEDCEPCVLAWMLDHLSANAWSWSERPERRRDRRFKVRYQLTQELTLVDISADGCQLEATGPSAQRRMLDVPLNALLPDVTLQLQVVRTRAAKEGNAFRLHGYFTALPAGIRDALQEVLTTESC